MTSPHHRPLRFGVCLFTPATRSEWVARTRQAESLGYHVVSVSDHLGMPAPMATLALIAEATERIRIGTLVLNTQFYNPTVLARDIATVDQYAGGRVEIGLGAGYDKAQFETAGLPWSGPRERVDHLERTVKELRRVLGAPETRPRPAQPQGPPLLIAGRGRRVLSWPPSTPTSSASPGRLPCPTATGSASAAWTRSPAASTRSAACSAPVCTTSSSTCRSTASCRHLPRATSPTSGATAWTPDS
ncbi:LLM class flavin-dependent oxidoreductase [Streptomyces diastatochromogenes]|nr:LLM class flavin-dependent oxidoreductase [Streptomyces diastatochromogenes]